MTKTTKWSVCPAKTQISLGIRPVWSESSLSAWRNTGSLATHWAHSEDSDQTGRMPRLIWVFAGRTNHFVGFVMRRLIYYFASRFCCNDINRNRLKEPGKICLKYLFLITSQKPKNIFLKHTQNLPKPWYQRYDVGTTRTFIKSSTISKVLTVMILSFRTGRSRQTV